MNDYLSEHLTPLLVQLTPLAAAVAQRAGVAALQSTMLIALGLSLGWLLRRRGAACASLIARATLALTLAVLILSPAAPFHTASPVAVPPVATVSFAPAPISPSAPQWDPEARAPLSEPPYRPSPSPPWWRTPGAPADAVAAIWLLGALFLLGRLLKSAMTLARLQRQCDRMTEGPIAVSMSGLCALASVPSITIRVGTAVEAPFLSGVFRPTLWLPSTIEREYQEDCLRAVLAHELEHWRRRDCAWLLISRIATALLWPQPLLWRLCRWMEQSSEELCDQAALAAPGVVARDYANCLLKIAETRVARPQALGVGVVSFRSTLGKRIAHILNYATNHVRLPAKLRFMLIAGLTIAAASALAVVTVQTDYGWRVPTGYADQFTVAHENGWDVAPVQYLPRGAKTPPMSSAEQAEWREAVRALKDASDSLAFSMESGYGPGKEVRISLEAYLSRHPHSAPAQYLLASYYQQHGEIARCKTLLASALRDAPAIVAGRVQYADGRPIAGYEFGIGLCYPKNESGEGSYSETLAFPVWTDSNGCYYVPVNHALIAWNEFFGRAPNGLNGVPPTVTDRIGKTMNVANPAYGHGWFTFSPKVGVLPPMIARPYVEWSLPQTLGGPDHSSVIHDDHLDLAWRPYTEATRYKMEITESYHPKPNETRGPESILEASFAPLQRSALFADGSAELTFRMRLNGGNPLMHRTSTYAMTIGAYAGDELLSKSRSFYFTPAQGLLPLPLSAKALQTYMPLGITINRVARMGNSIVVFGRDAAPSATSWDALAQTRWFDLPLTVGRGGTAGGGFEMRYGNNF